MEKYVKAIHPKKRKNVIWTRISVPAIRAIFSDQRIGSISAIQLNHVLF